MAVLPRKMMEQTARTFSSQRDRGSHDPSQVAAFALEAARRGAKVLVVRNTVRAAIDTQRALEFARLLMACTYSGSAS